MSAGVREYLAQVAKESEQTLDRLLPLRQTAPEAELYFAMRYSLFAGGKRLRPALFCATLAAFGLERTAFLPFACGLEMIHTYSLIHDDLPCMDDDDLRRGQPACHKLHGEAMALLAGDGLLTHAFTWLADPIPAVAAERQLAAVKEVAFFAGIGGMVAGQAAELASMSRPMDPGLARYIDLGKTAGLFAAAVLSAAQLAGADGDQRQALRRYAEGLGLAFQITDDLLDQEGDPASLGKAVGRDAARGLTTYPALVGAEQARQEALAQAQAAQQALAGFSAQADLLRQLAAFTIERCC